MSPTVMEAAPPVDPDIERQSEVDQIISKARATRPGFLPAVGMSLASGLLLWLAFMPVDWGPIAWVALVPVLMFVRLPQSPARMYRALYVGGLAFWLMALQWMRLGDPTMYFAWGALALYAAVYWPAFVGLSRIAVHRYRLPLVAAAPVTWTGLEFLRAHLLTGFPWYLLGHTQHRWVELIQISDLVGAYGVGFVIVMANACAAEFVPLRWAASLELSRSDQSARVLSEQGLHRGYLAAGVVVITLSATLIYGSLRRGGTGFDAGPRVALIQGNYPAYVRTSMTAEEVFQEWAEIYRTHRALTGLTVPHQPDVIIWPEVMFRYPLFEHEAGMSEKELSAAHPQIPQAQWTDRAGQKNLEELAEQSGAALIIGVDVHETTRADAYRHFNSAVYVDPDRGIQGRYDKIHRVIFGEYIPLKEWMPFLAWMTPYSGDFGIDAGQTVQLFKHKERTFLPIICFEDTVPHLVRKMVRTAESEGQHVDCLVNLSNDGWFHGSSELDQHLITAKFRCVETRVPMVRAVNTGISAVIDGDGVVRDPEVFIDFDARLSGDEPRESLRDPRTGRFYKQMNCALVGAVPLDRRSSLYVLWGDWFAIMCLVSCLATGLHGVAGRASRGV